MAADAPCLIQTPAPTVEMSALRDAARSALGQLAARRPELIHRRDAERWLERTVALLAHNIAAGRQPRQTALSDYAVRVLEGQLTDGERVEAFRLGDGITWIAIIEHLERRAYHRLGPQGRHEWAAAEARELAAGTCADLWEWLQTHPFPFDVSFDRWLVRSLDNRLYHRSRRRAVEQRRSAASLDQPVRADGTTFGDLIRANYMDAWLERELQRETCSAALARLEPRQAQVIRLWHLEGWPAAEIAAALGLQIGHLYVLHSRALAKLRQLMPGG